MARSSKRLVFISHAAKDRWIARQMAEIIERSARRHGVVTFLDEVGHRGWRRILQIIKAQLQACDEFLILLSPHSIERQWVLVELGGAWTMDKRIVAITHEVPREKIPDIIDHDKSYDLNDFDRYVFELVRRARGERIRE